MKKVLIAMILVAFATFGMVGLAQAVPVTYFGEDPGVGEGTALTSWPNAAAAEADFLSNLVGVGTENFESFASGTIAPLPLNFPGAGTATLMGDGKIDNINNYSGSTNGVGRYPISGDQYWEVSSQLFSILFSDPIAAFGFYGIDAGDFQGQLTLDLVNGGTQTLEIPHTVGSPGGTVIYFGIIETENLFTSITFGNTGSSADYFAFDDMTIGSLAQVQPVPEPATMLLLGSGLVGLAGLGRKKFFKK